MVYEPLKRIIDIVLAVILLILFLPVSIVTAIAIKRNSAGPVLADTPQRVGKDGRLFHLYKFRSMVVNAHNLLRQNPSFKKLYAEYRRSGYKLYQDPRVTPVGKYLRKHSIDEIPQLLNVIKGDMSLVGPRPYYPDELEEQQRKYPHTRRLVKEVLSVRPGVSGAWQVSGRSEVNFDKRIKMDADYARRRSILYDILILAKTPWAMISGKGAV